MCRKLLTRSDIQAELSPTFERPPYRWAAGVGESAMSNSPEHHCLSYDDYTWMREQLEPICRWLEQMDETIGVHLDDETRSDLGDKASQAVERLQEVLTFIKQRQGFEKWEKLGW
jgi:hypothetical protein